MCVYVKDYFKVNQIALYKNNQMLFRHHGPLKTKHIVGPTTTTKHSS